MSDKESKSRKNETKIDENLIFSKENVNMGHQPEFDYLKTLGVYEIVLTHVYITFSYGYLIKFIRHIAIMLSAGGLMILMGMGMRYSRHHELKYYIARGFVLLTVSQYFNILRDSLPNLIAWWATGQKNFISRAMLVLQTDILTFSGLAYFLLALMKKMKLSDNSILIIGIIMNFVCYPLFKLVKFPDNFLINQFLAYFIPTYAEAYFPLCTYFIFVAFGYWMGGIYLKISNKDKFYNRILIFFLPIVAVYHSLRTYNKIPLLPEFSSSEHYCISPGPDAIARCIANLVALAIFYKMNKILGGTPEIIAHCGKNLNQYYMISYTITMHIGVFMKAIRGEKSTSEYKYSDILAFMLLFLSRILIDLNDKYIHFTITTLKNPMRNIVFALIWILTVVLVIYIYPKVEVYATVWNDYLEEEY